MYKRRYVTTGRGKYSVGRAWRKSGLAKTTAKVGRDIISSIGANVVSSLAQNSGAAMAGTGGHGMYTGGGMYTGSGMYTGAPVHANSLIQGKDYANIIPEFSHSPDESGTIIMSRREYISDVYAPDHLSGDSGPLIPFSSQIFNLNPALEKCFPFMSQIAQNYEEYEFLQLIFTFRSTTTDIGSSTSGQCGTIIMTTNYNAAAAPFYNKSTMMEYMGSMSCKATESMLHGVECDPKKLSLPANGLYTRANPVITSQDLKTYDHALFQIAEANAPENYANQVLGELWVSYTCKLRKPKLFTGLGLGISRDLFVGNDFTGVVLDHSQAGQLGWFGKDPLRGQQNNIGCKVDIPVLTNAALEDGFRVTFPASYNGTLRLSYWMRADHLEFETSPIWWDDDLDFGPGANNSPRITGNVEIVKDIYGSYNADPTLTSPYPDYIVQCQNDRIAMVIIHLRIQPATNGVDNTFWFQPKSYNYHGEPILQTQLDITEYNSGFSFRAANISLSDAPILVNKQGVLVNNQI